MSYLPLTDGAKDETVAKELTTAKASKLGEPVHTTISADIAAVQESVDNLEVSSSSGGYVI